MTRPALTRAHYALIVVIALGAVAIAAIGFYGSYHAVRDLALSYGFGRFASFLPIGVDAGIVVLLALDLLLSWLRIPYATLRRCAWLLTAATIYLNARAAEDATSLVLHSVIPLLFVIIVEAGRHAVARLAGIKAGEAEMEGLGKARWGLAFFRTFSLWRRGHLWGITSRAELLQLEQRRHIYRAQMRRKYGKRWRRRAPKDALLPLELAALGVPFHLTYEAGLEAAGLPTDRYGVFFTQEQPARPAVAGSADVSAPALEAAPAAEPGQVVEADAGQQIAIAELVREAVAQALADAQHVQGVHAQPATDQAAHAQPEVPAHAHEDCWNAAHAHGGAHAQVSADVDAQGDAHAWTSARARVAEQSVPMPIAVPQPAQAARTGLQVSAPAADQDAHTHPAEPAEQWIDAAADLRQLPKQEPRLPAADTVSRTTAATEAEPLQAPQPAAAQMQELATGLPRAPFTPQPGTDVVDLYYRAWRSFVQEHRRTPQRPELAQLLFDQFGVAGKSGDKPLSPDSLRRYWPTLQELHTEEHGTVNQPDLLDLTAASS
ncbi:DUF2637 domain-containing protein [Streptomyces sp. NRRL B-24484]|uniref:DUF2637 domain-containing protein n=1 Tax=Streptomyces sp. NRRL B-24484 TaxID=1463833 RepID=UPI000694552E|nr:DUF2637 domain-containing protein [Streptomyces sp. NRRL B-24484]